MKRRLHLRVANVLELRSFASTLANMLIKESERGGLDVCLAGDLGAGKTTLTRLLAEDMGCSQKVSSPSYVVQHEYVARSGLILEHWDLYRLGSVPEELLEPVRDGTIRLVEWGNKAPAFEAGCRLKIEMRIGDNPEEREVDLFLV